MRKHHANLLRLGHRQSHITALAGLLRTRLSREQIQLNVKFWCDAVYLQCTKPPGSLQQDGCKALMRRAVRFNCKVC
jgi:hypothetical protein